MNGAIGRMGVRKAVVLGGYGLIGSVCMRALADAGFRITGIGRSKSAAMRIVPSADWLIRDITKITVEEWRSLLVDVDVVVNASGALQDGAQDNLEAIHVRTVTRLVEAAAGLPLRIIQISAAGVSEGASTAFFRTKARGDTIIASRAVDWVILRPTLVLSHEAYGGTALLRAVAALPLIAPRIMPDAQVQTVHVSDIAEAVVTAARSEVPSGLIADLTEPEAHAFRIWLRRYGTGRVGPQRSFARLLPPSSCQRWVGAPTCLAISDGARRFEPRR